MNLSGFSALDAAIGLAALFFLLSTVCSSINEGISSALGWRAKTLEDAIRNMLGEADAKKGDLTEQLFAHWRIKSLVRDPKSSRRRRNRPSYLPPKAFSRALAEVVAVLPEDVTDTPDTLWKQTDDAIFAKVEAAVAKVPSKQLRALVGRA
jgi:hypothetical protein